MAAVLACAPAVASHSSAEWLWDLSVFRPSTYEMTGPTKRRSKPGIRVHSADLPRNQITVIDAIPVTSLPRTVLDLAARVNRKRVEGLLKSAEELRDEEGRGAFDLRAFESLLAAARATADTGL